jgi:hypothetical protein
MILHCAIDGLHNRCESATNSTTIIPHHWGSCEYGPRTIAPVVELNETRRSKSVSSREWSTGYKQNCVVDAAAYTWPRSVTNGAAHSAVGHAEPPSIPGNITSADVHCIGVDASRRAALEKSTRCPGSSSEVGEFFQATTSRSWIYQANLY